MASRTSAFFRCLLNMLKPQCSKTGPADELTVKSSLLASSSNCCCGCVMMICASPAFSALICASVSVTKLIWTPSIFAGAPWFTTSGLTSRGTRRSW